MNSNVYTELLEIRKELHFAGIPILEDEGSYSFSEDYGEDVKDALQRESANWDGETLTLKGSEPFPDQLIIINRVPVKTVWIRTQYGVIAFNPNTNPKIYFRDGFRDEKGQDEAIKIDEIMSHYLYTKIKSYEPFSEALEHSSPKIII